MMGYLRPQDYPNNNNNLHANCKYCPHQIMSIYLFSILSMNPWDIYIYFSNGAGFVYSPNRCGIW